MRNPDVPTDEAVESSEQPGGASVVDYTNILHAHGLGSPEADAYKKQYEADAVFQKRAKVLDDLMKAKASGEL